MSVFLISANVLLWAWQIRRFRGKRANVRDKVIVYSLYAIALGLGIMLAENWIIPDLLRPFISLLGQVNRLFGTG
ncbi:hypothetical protein GC101_04455 [Paenibacillus sp. LMG 31459]|jgi:hypothetical protein|uniref:Uncharacterized protein n=1 Tax=Paenibacillus phytohabitans TaxID=2654978 RepID=A0ABX1YB41_9BACL|nr:hypothetical protein [Paenibacillus phytohabitans]NOU78127.1 hypothetical protein [Paenibacillus phytohabitans]